MCESKPLVGILCLFIVLISSSTCHIQLNKPSIGGHESRLSKRTDDQNETSARDSPPENIKQDNKNKKKQLPNEVRKEIRRLKINAYHKQLSYKGLQKSKETLSTEEFARIEKVADRRRQRQLKYSREYQHRLRTRFEEGKLTAKDLEMVHRRNEYKTRRDIEAKQKTAKRKAEAVQNKLERVAKNKKIKNQIEIQNTNQAAFAQLSPLLKWAEKVKNTDGEHPQPPP